MALKSRENLVAAWAFLIGVVLALLVGVLSASIIRPNAIILTTLLILGFVVGFGLVNVNSRDIQTFLFASVALVIVSYMGSESISKIELLTLDIGYMIAATLSAMLVMLVPATIIVAIKSLFSISAT